MSKEPPRRTPVRGARPAKQARPRLTKESIIKTALELLRADPSEPVTFERVATAMGVAAMSLYVHVGPREALIDAVAEHVLSTFRVDVDPAQSWQTQLQRCIEEIFRLVREMPAPMTLLARVRSGSLVGWAALTTPMLEILVESTDLDGADLARAVNWLNRSVIAMSVLDASFPTPTVFYNVAASLDRVPEQQRQLLMPVLPFMALADESHGPRAAFLARRIVDGLEGHLAEVRARKSDPVAAARVPSRPVKGRRHARRELSREG